ncbi:hypothetical protein B0H17DRAFT_1304004 [Mycena rosella]|uniref:SET domain-containing protein n=1 Tax=Mycena rosella TaxID=1033263 RepID=A0AAD7GE12_MYCRO|nr:hypothetical protein B0H17DRAFT_1304004 [Mycena rosella]
MKRGFLKTSKTQARPLGPVPAPQPDSKTWASISTFLSAKFKLVRTVFSRPEYETNDSTILAVPEGLKEKIRYQECDPHGGSTPDCMTFTTLPNGMEPGEPVTECFFFPGSKEVFMNLRGFPQPMVHPSTPAFRMAATPDKGTALFSTRKLKAGDHILTERPLFVGARGAPTEYHANLTREQNTQYALNTLEQHFEISFKRMSTESKEAFMALANSHKEDGSGPLVGVVRTNGLRLSGLRPGVKGDMGSYTAVCKDISRLNHSCSPNTSARFDMLSFSYQLFAVHDIAKGEELTYQYTPINCSAAERNKALVPYGFVCACTACTNAPTSDPRRAAIEAFRPVVTEWV